MRNSRKKFWYKLTMISFIAILSIGFSITAFAYDETELTEITEGYLSSWNETDFQTYITDDSIEEADKEQFKAWQRTKESIGTFQKIDEITFREEEELVQSILIATYEKGNLTFTIDFDLEALESYGAAYAIMMIDAVSGTITPDTPSMGKAIMNTIMGMGIVFIVLIFMAWAFSLIKYVPKIFNKSQNPISDEIVQSVEQVVSSIEEREENLIHDSELVAVITGAIMAATTEQEITGGLVVRSIRRRK